MASLPFGFGPTSTKQAGKPAPKRYNPFDPKQIKWALQNSGGSGMGGMAAMMGIPFQQKRGNMWMTIDPQRHSVYPSGTTPYYGPGSAGYGNGGGGDDTPPTDPNNPPLPADKYPKNMIPEWWKEWYRTSGQYGGVPPVDGLL